MRLWTKKGKERSLLPLLLYFLKRAVSKSCSAPVSEEEGQLTAVGLDRAGKQVLVQRTTRGHSGHPSPPVATPPLLPSPLSPCLPFLGSPPLWLSTYALHSTFLISLTCTHACAYMRTHIHSRMRNALASLKLAIWKLRVAQRRELKKALVLTLPLSFISGTNRMSGLLRPPISSFGDRRGQTRGGEMQSSKTEDRCPGGVFGRLPQQQPGKVHKHPSYSPNLHLREH